MRQNYVFTFLNLQNQPLALEEKKMAKALLVLKKTKLLSLVRRVLNRQCVQLCTERFCVFQEQGFQLPVL